MICNSCSLNFLSSSIAALFFSAFSIWIRSRCFLYSSKALCWFNFVWTAIISSSSCLRKFKYLLYSFFSVSACFFFKLLVLTFLILSLAPALTCLPWSSAEYSFFALYPPLYWFLAIDIFAIIEEHLISLLP
jgi:hypothetical protein